MNKINTNIVCFLYTILMNQNCQQFYRNLILDNIKLFDIIFYDYAVLKKNTL